ncbi:chemotaxis protein CheC [Caenibacillus caldisaponilyticus]|uniref:chemotaxis protein CheC n=1 Tax=Caenibacillus caldisaponilyticus TaxID=1674942 RepID=UPI00098869C7|nr:chemotaxis protein CheC [Caenibacillus caldisaponilyticus]
MSALFNLNEKQLDLLKEIANMGVGHAATALSSLIGQTVEMTVPSVRVASFTEWLGADDPERTVCAVYFRTTGDLNGHLFILFPTEDTERLLEVLIAGKSGGACTLTNPGLESSAFGEVGNILAGSYLSVLSNFTGIAVQPSPPSISVDMASAILAEGLIDLSLYGDEVIVIDAELRNSGTAEPIQCAFTFLPDPEDLETFMKMLGVADV